MSRSDKMKRCPKCGCEEFYVTAHVVQDWIVDCNGDYIKTTEDCVEVAHYPKDDDIWTDFNDILEMFADETGLTISIKVEKGIDE